MIAGQPLALGRIERRAAVAVVVGGVDHGAELGLADRQDARVLEPRQRAGERHVGVEHRRGVRQQAMDRRMDAVAGALDVALAGLALAVVADLHEAARRHLGPVQAERDLVVAVVGAGHAEREVIEDPLVEAVHHGEPVRGREIDPRLPLRRADVDISLVLFLGRRPASSAAFRGGVPPLRPRR